MNKGECRKLKDLLDAIVDLRNSFEFYKRELIPSNIKHAKLDEPYV